MLLKLYCITQRRRCGQRWRCTPPVGLASWSTLCPMLPPLLPPNHTPPMAGGIPKPLVAVPVHPALQATPGQLVFGRGMPPGPQTRANWPGARPRKQAPTGKGVVVGGGGGAQHGYATGGKVLYTPPGATPEPNRPRGGPHKVKGPHANGAVAIGQALPLAEPTPAMPLHALGEPRVVLLLGSECSVMAATGLAPPQPLVA